MTDPHILKSFDEALAALSDRFARMGTLVADNCTMAVRAYLDGDSQLALQVVNRDLDIDEAFESLRNDCLGILLRFQPVARDLRLVIGMEHALKDLERAGDHAKNIARRVISGPSGPAEGDETHLPELADLVTTALRSGVDAMIRRNSEDAKHVIVADARIDDRFEAIFDEVMVKLRTTASDAPWLVQRIFVSKALERIGDHATNIAEEVLFMTRGVPAGATRPNRNAG